MDSLDTPSLPIDLPPQILSIVPAGTLLEPPSKAWFPMPNPASWPQKIIWGDPGLSQLRGSGSLTLLRFVLGNLSFSPPLSCFLNPLRLGYTSWDHRWKAESFCLHSILSPLRSCWLSSPLPVSPSPCYYLKFLPPLPLPLAASSCSLCALDSFVPLFRNTL